MDLTVLRFLKHPHERGEDVGGIAGTLLKEETPPRAWGRLLLRIWRTGCHRNTPTSVGKTARKALSAGERRKHPHERGEDRAAQTPSDVHKETPPRAWGRLTQLMVRRDMSRNTPTSVGKTSFFPPALLSRRKHPHERGEDPLPLARTLPSKETPPRAWGRRKSAKGGRNSGRNTPTSVGKTGRRSGPAHHGGKHPHERGEDTT